jgi:TolB-like protein
MTRTHLLVALAALSLLAAAPPARAEDPVDAGKRLGTSLARQLATHPPRTPVAAVAIAPPKAGAAPQVGEVAEAIAGALDAAGIQVRDWAALDRALAERVARGAFQGELDLPTLPEVQAIVVVEASALADQKLRVQTRLVLVPGGAALAADAATVDLQPVAVPVAGGPVAPVQSGSLEVTMRRMADGLAAGFYALPGSARYRRLAVLDFAEAGELARKRELGKVVAAELTTNLRRDHDLFLVERARLGAVLGELKLAQMGAVDVSKAAEVGRLADAQALVIGSVSDAGDRFLVDARIVAAETGETLAVASEAISAATLVALSSNAVVLRSRRDAVFRSLVVPGWGQFYNRQPVKGAAVAAAEGLVLAGAAYLQLQGMRAEDDYHRRSSSGDLGANPSSRAASLRRKAERSYRGRNALLWSALGIWALNVADAWYSGVDGEKLVTTAAVPLEGGLGVAVAARF